MHILKRIIIKTTTEKKPTAKRPVKKVNKPKKLVLSNDSRKDAALRFLNEALRSIAKVLCECKKENIIRKYDTLLTSLLDWVKSCKKQKTTYSFNQADKVAISFASITESDLFEVLSNILRAAGCSNFYSEILKRSIVPQVFEAIQKKYQGSKANNVKEAKVTKVEAPKFIAPVLKAIKKAKKVVQVKKNNQVLTTAQKLRKQALDIAAKYNPIERFMRSDFISSLGFRSESVYS